MYCTDNNVLYHYALRVSDACLKLRQLLGRKCLGFLVKYKNNNKYSEWLI